MRHVPPPLLLTNKDLWYWDFLESAWPYFTECSARDISLHLPSFRAGAGTGSFSLSTSLGVPARDCKDAKNWRDI